MCELFDPQGGGFLTDTEVLNRLVTEKLAAVGESVTAEGWKWVEVGVEHDYVAASRMKRVYPEHVTPDEAAQAKLDELDAKAEALAESSDEYHEGIEQEPAALDAEISALRGDASYQPGDIARAGVFISLSHGGRPFFSEHRAAELVIDHCPDPRRDQAAGEALGDLAHRR